MRYNNYYYGYYDDYDYDYEDRFEEQCRRNTIRLQVAQKHASVGTIYEWMDKHSFYDLGFNYILSFLEKKDDPISKMYYHALKAEIFSSLSKTSTENYYSNKESELKLLVEECKKWRTEYATESDNGTPKPEKPDFSKITSPKKQRKAQRNYSKKLEAWKNRDKIYTYQDSEKEIAFGINGTSTPGVNSVIYFDLPGCEQLSFHTKLTRNSFTAVSKYNKTWDGIENSTLNKLEYAIIKLYGEEILKENTLNQNLVSEYNEIINQLYNIRRNNKTSNVHTIVDLYQNLMSDYVNLKITDENLNNYKIFFNPLDFTASEIISELPDNDYGNLCKNLIYIAAVKTFAEKYKDNYYPKNAQEEILNYIRNITEISKNSKSIQCFRKNKAFYIFGNKINGNFRIYFDKLDNSVLNTVAAPDADFNDHLYNNGASDLNPKNAIKRLPKILVSLFGDNSLKELVHKNELQKEENERIKQEREERERKEREERERKYRQEKIDKLNNFEYFTKSMLKEQWNWTDTLIEKFAGKPDMYKKNPVYSSADPMALYSKARIMEIEKKPEFIEELKKSFKRRHLNWPYENDVITHGSCRYVERKDSYWF